MTQDHRDAGLGGRIRATAVEATGQDWQLGGLPELLPQYLAHRQPSSGLTSGHTHPVSEVPCLPHRQGGCQPPSSAVLMSPELWAGT